MRILKLLLLFLLAGFGKSNLYAQRPTLTPPMTTAADPSFEVATIKPTNPDGSSHANSGGGRSFEMQSATLSYLIAFAYDLNESQIVGAPSWVATDKFDLRAQPSGGYRPNLMQLKTMMRKLIADRFALATHNDKKMLSVYALTVAKGGPKLTKDDTDPNGFPSLHMHGLGKSTVNNATMSEFASLLQDGILDRPVLDQTGLSGKYDFSLNWTPDDSQFTHVGLHVPPAADDTNAPPGLFTAIQEQIGLKLEAKRAQADVLVVDHVEKPSAN